MRTLVTLLLFGLLSSLHVQAQDEANHQLYLIKLEPSDSSYTLSQAKYLSAYNPSGDNITPSFISPTKIFVSSTTDKNGYEQTDIFELDLVKEQKIKITSTLENELYPKNSPNAYNFTAIREEADVDRTKRLWKFPVRVKHEQDMGEALFPYLGGIQNYAWINRNIAALVIEGNNENRLFLGKVTDNSTIFISSGVGECIFKAFDSNDIYYVDKTLANKWFIKKAVLSGQTKEDLDIQSITIAETLSNVDHFSLLPNNTIISSKGSKLFILAYSNSEDTYTWKEVADLKPIGITNIQSIEVHNDWQVLLVTNNRR